MLPQKTSNNQAKSSGCRFAIDAKSIISALPLPEIIQSRGIELHPSGPGRYRSICPFHDEKTPSFFVFEKTNKFKCFGCGEHGDAIDFVRKLDGCSFRDAVERLTGQAPERYRPDPAAIRRRRLVGNFRRWEAKYSDFLCHWRGAACRMIERDGPEGMDENHELIRLLGVVDQQLGILASGNDMQKYTLYRAIRSGEGLDYVYI